MCLCHRSSVDQNELTGPIPPSWGKLHNLYVVNVTSNEGLCGAVPDGVSGVLDRNTTSLNTHCLWTDDGKFRVPPRPVTWAQSYICSWVR